MVAMLFFLLFFSGCLHLRNSNENSFIKVSEKEKELHEAIYSRNGFEVKSLLKEGVNPSCRNNGDTPAILASCMGDSTILKYLVEYDANLEGTIHAAAYLGNDKVIKYLTEELSIPCREIRVLIEKDSIVFGAEEGLEMTPLMVASFFQRESTVELLLKRGFDTSYNKSIEILCSYQKNFSLFREEEIKNHERRALRILKLFLKRGTSLKIDHFVICGRHGNYNLFKALEMFDNNAHEHILEQKGYLENNRLRENIGNYFSVKINGLDVNINSLIVVCQEAVEFNNIALLNSFDAIPLEVLNKSLNEACFFGREKLVSLFLNKFEALPTRSALISTFHGLSKGHCKDLLKIPNMIVEKSEELRNKGSDKYIVGAPFVLDARILKKREALLVNDSNNHIATKEEISYSLLHFNFLEDLRRHVKTYDSTKTRREMALSLLLSSFEVYGCIDCDFEPFEYLNHLNCYLIKWGRAQKYGCFTKGEHDFINYLIYKADINNNEEYDHFDGFTVDQFRKNMYEISLKEASNGLPYFAYKKGDIPFVLSMLKKIYNPELYEGNELCFHTFKAKEEITMLYLYSGFLRFFEELCNMEGGEDDLDLFVKALGGVNQNIYKGVNPLKLFASQGKIGLLEKWLVKGGTKENICGGCLSRILMASVLGMKAKVVEYMGCLGGDVNFMSRGDPLIYLTLQSQKPLGVVAKMISMGADLEHRNSRGHNFLESVLFYERYEHLEEALDANIPTKILENFVEVIIANDFLRAMEIVVKKGFFTVNGGLTYFELALRKNDEKMARLVALGIYDSRKEEDRNISLYQQLLSAKKMHYADMLEKIVKDGNENFSLRLSNPSLNFHKKRQMDSRVSKFDIWWDSIPGATAYELIIWKRDRDKEQKEYLYNFLMGNSSQVITSSFQIEKGNYLAVVKAKSKNGDENSGVGEIVISVDSLPPKPNIISIYSIEKGMCFKWRREEEIDRYHVTLKLILFDEEKSIEIFKIVSGEEEETSFENDFVDVKTFIVRISSSIVMEEGLEVKSAPSFVEVDALSFFKN